MTTILIIITFILSVSAFYSPNLMEKWILYPQRVVKDNEYHRILTSGFLHANWIHLIINMIILWSFGAAVEGAFDEIFSSPRLNYVILYTSALIVSSVPTVFKHKEHANYASLGASGAVSAVVFTYILFYPWNPLYIWGVLPMPGILLGILYLGYSAYMANKGSDNINHDAHFYGAIFGMVFTIILKPGIFEHFINQLKDLPL